jgi:hypothetical protein
VADARPHAGQPNGLVDSVGAGYDCASVVASACRGEEEQEGAPDPGAGVALERFSAMSVPERAAEVLKWWLGRSPRAGRRPIFKHGADMERRVGEVNARLECIEAAVGEGLGRR